MLYSLSLNGVGFQVLAGIVYMLEQFWINFQLEICQVVMPCCAFDPCPKFICAHFHYMFGCVLIRCGIEEFGMFILSYFALLPIFCPDVCFKFFNLIFGYLQEYWRGYLFNA